MAWGKYQHFQGYAFCTFGMANEEAFQTGAVAALLVRLQILLPISPLNLYFQSFVVKCGGSFREDLSSVIFLSRAAMLENPAGSDATLNAAQISKPSKLSRNIEKWQGIKDDVYQIYIIKDDTLAQTIQFIAQKHDFHARQASNLAHQSDQALTMSIVSEPGKQR